MYLTIPGKAEGVHLTPSVPSHTCGWILEVHIALVTTKPVLDSLYVGRSGGVFVVLKGDLM